MQIDVDGTGTISISELGDALATVGLKLPAYEVRNLIRRFDTRIKDDCLDFEEFKMVGWHFICLIFYSYRLKVSSYPAFA